MSDETDVSEPDETEQSEGTLKTLEHELSAVTHAEMGGMLQAGTGPAAGRGQRSTPRRSST